MASRGLAYKVTDPTTMVTEICCNCGVMFALTEAYQTERYGDRKSFYCPNGHSLSYPGQTDAQKLKAAEAQRIAERDQRLAAEAALATERKASAAVKKKLDAANKKLKSTEVRAANGVCPCCQRSFTDTGLARHIATKHPEFTAASSVAAP